MQMRSSPVQGRGRTRFPACAWFAGLLVLLAGTLLPGCGPTPGTAPVDAVEKKVRLLGLEAKAVFRGGGRITGVSAILPDPLSVTLEDPSGSSPLAQIPVEFLVLGPQGRLVHEGREADSREVLSSRDGTASILLKTPEKPRDVWVRVRVLDPETREPLLEHRFVTYSVDYGSLAFAMLGGLAIFLFGMRLMTTALQAIAGERLRTILGNVTSTPLSGLLAGALITGIIQSSSATTVMTVGLVNAGLMSLGQAVPVMFGANIGTTITGQLISFKISQYAFPMMFLGLLASIAGPSRRHRHGGEVIFGLGMLFMGMDLMEGVFKPLAQSAEFKSIFVAFSVNPLYGILAGTLVTVLIQSSSATVGLTLTLAASGFLDFPGAFGLILGDNIGTTITAILASISARPSARQAALVHSLFNICGAAIMLALLMVPWDGHPVFLSFIDSITAGDVWANPPQALERHVANAHSMFNVTFAVLFLPLAPWFAALARKILPDRDEGPPTRLAPALLDTPPLALRSVRLEMADVAVKLREMFTLALGCIHQWNEKHFDAVVSGEEGIDRMREQISHYLVQISEHELDAPDAERIPRLLHAINDLERFGDMVEEAAKLARRRSEKALPFPDEALAEVGRLQTRIDAMLDSCIRVLREGSRASLDEMRRLESDVNRSEDRFRKNHIRRLREGNADLLAGIVFLDLLTVIEKMGDYLDNVGNALGEIE